MTAFSAFSQARLQDGADKLEAQGKFTDADLVLGIALAQPNLTESQRAKLEFQRDRLRRIRLDFPLTRSDLLAELKKSVARLTPSEFETWVREGRFASRQIDGREFFMVASVSNLFFRYPELSARRIPPKAGDALDERYFEVITAVKKQAVLEGQPYVLPKRFQITMTVAAASDAAPAGNIISAWLPIPRSCPFQTDFELVNSKPPGPLIDRPSSPARAVYLEQTAQKGQPTEFRIEYEYTARGAWFDLNPASGRPVDLTDPALAPFLQETEHVRFTPEIRALSQRILAGETNPCQQARRFYNWISENIKYSYALEYSTVPNLSEECRVRGYGDCGQEALLFITLCRLNGIPARWQSGWTLFPGAKANHDWTEIYLASLGWVPVDPYMGIYATRYATTLSQAQQSELRDFYFGGLDPYRMIANNDHNQPLNPHKKTMRSDTVDFQRGELESGDRNLYFDQFTYELHAIEVQPHPSKVD